MQRISRRNFVECAALAAPLGTAAERLGMAEQRAGYVPEPEPAATDYLIGAHYFPGWKQGAHRAWGPVVPYPNRTPLLGYYDEGSPEVADWEIKWALEHGINYFVYCWYRGPNKGKPVTTENMYLGHAIHEGLLRAKYASRFHFAIMYENQSPPGGVVSADDLTDNLLAFWMENYFKNPSYLKVDGKPVLFIYHLQRLMADLNGADGVRLALDRLRAEARKQGFAGLHILAEYRGKDPKVLTSIRECGFDASFAYCWHTPQKRPTGQQAIANQIDHMTTWRELGILPYLPTASVAWDPMPWQKTDPKSPWLNPANITRWNLAPEEYEKVLRWCKGLMDGLPRGSLGRRMLLLDNWNEWSEGHYIAPHAAAGFGHLKAVREVFTRRDNHPDYRSPYELGLGPYDSLYQKALKAGTL